MLTSSLTPIDGRPTIKNEKVMRILADALLSAEAKAVVAHEFHTGIAAEISTVIELELEVSVFEQLLHEMIVAGWGEQIGQYFKVINTIDSNEHETLRHTQLAVRSGSALFAAAKVTTANAQRYYLSVHHALADEHTLEIIRNYLKLSNKKAKDLVLNDMDHGRQAYCRYVKRQQTKAKEASALVKVSTPHMAPLILSQDGRLAWNAQAKRISVQRRLNTQRPAHEIRPIDTVLTRLSEAGVILQGNTLCSSKNWRLADETHAIGMMTGLITKPLKPSTKSLCEPDIALEASARYSPDARAALECCRRSEIFINGAAPRRISGTQVIDTAFPVGLDIRRTGEFEIQFEIEGPFSSKAAVIEVLNELTDVF
ncbi:hypothetical protein Sden_0633 [Shewanella denitrificans OS217]|jgi:hypothetical protein|uniref:Uncharacterized protein n=1 Tax=Shewanella denitrificans (strain OS217 / ATCC BAA-1090 / DSM 15013) TaxID=318161 RepID=Q12RK3_SHEDO|nr:hypothetical protein [Shewanella denitrificans]ABE53923.1 hypothetical protein Sden_0633 [Shewanella denitrificans OS217]